MSQLMVLQYLRVWKHDYAPITMSEQVAVQNLNIGNNIDLRIYMGITLQNTVKNVFCKLLRELLP